MTLFNFTYVLGSKKYQNISIKFSIIRYLTYIFKKTNKKLYDRNH